jgi:phage shock protein A
MAGVPRPRRRLTPSERNPDRVVEAHNLVDQALQRVEAGTESLAKDVADLAASAEDIVDADESHVLNATYDKNEVQDALDALAEKLNQILTALRTVA